MDRRLGLGCVMTFALDGPVDSLIVAVSNAGRAASLTLRRRGGKNCRDRECGEHDFCG
jgi:hypothetical protein